MAKEFTVDIVESFYRATDDDRAPVSVDVISWNKGEAKLNIRRMYKDKESGELKFGKGVSLSDHEVLTVYNALTAYIKQHGITAYNGVKEE